MRCDGKPVRPGTGTTHRMSKASEPDKQNGTLFANSIRASSLNRLHQQAGQKTAPDQCHCVNLALATREPSTEDIGDSANKGDGSACLGSGTGMRRWDFLALLDGAVGVHGAQSGYGDVGGNCRGETHKRGRSKKRDLHEVCMRRREFTGLSRAATVWAAATGAQEAARLQRIGILQDYAEDDRDPRSWLRSFSE